MRHPRSRGVRARGGRPDDGERDVRPREGGQPDRDRGPVPLRTRTDRHFGRPLPILLGVGCRRGAANQFRDPSSHPDVRGVPQQHDEPGQRDVVRAGDGPVHGVLEEPEQRVEARRVFIRREPRLRLCPVRRDARRRGGPRGGRPLLALPDPTAPRGSASWKGVAAGTSRRGPRPEVNEIRQPGPAPSARTQYVGSSMTRYVGRPLRSRSATHARNRNCGSFSPAATYRKGRRARSSSESPSQRSHSFPQPVRRYWASRSTGFCLPIRKFLTTAFWTARSARSIAAVPSFTGSAPAAILFSASRRNGTASLINSRNSSFPNPSRQGARHRIVPPGRTARAAVLIAFPAWYTLIPRWRALTITMSATFGTSATYTRSRTRRSLR